MNSLVSVNWMISALNASRDGTSGQPIWSSRNDNLQPSTYRRGTLSQPIRRGGGENLVPNASNRATLNQPIRHGWGENILPFEVADQLHKAALMRPSLETAPSIDRPPAETMGLSPHQRHVQYLPPEVPLADRSKRPSFVALQEWEGIVTQIHDQVFTARVTDLTHPKNPEEEGEFFINEVNEDDFDLIAPGAIFRWSVGVLKMPGGGKRATSQVVFRRLPQWTKRDLLRADALAKELARTFEQNEASGVNEER